MINRRKLMVQRQPIYYNVLQKYDPEFFAVVLAVREKVQTIGALDAKTKTLVSLALDTAA